MKRNTQKSSITLPREEFQLVSRLKHKLRLKSNVEVIRRSLKLLAESEERQTLRKLYQEAALQVKQDTELELQELDHLSGERMV